MYKEIFTKVKVIKEKRTCKKNLSKHENVYTKYSLIQWENQKYRHIIKKTAYITFDKYPFWDT